MMGLTLISSVLFKGSRMLILLLCFSLLACSCATAQQYHFKNFTVADGLGSTTINHIFQDSRGYIWFATQGGGVSRFNGKAFKTFTHTGGLISNDVTHITEDKQGNIWIATANGASQFDGSRFINYGQKEGLTDGVVYDVCVVANRIWFATQNEGIKILTPGKGFDSLTIKDGLPSNEIYCLVRAQNGALIIGLGNGIASYVNGRIKPVIVNNKTFFSGGTTTDGKVWMGSTGGDLVCLSAAGQLKQVVLPTNLQHDFIGSIATDKQNNLWLSTDHGLLFYDGQTFTLFGEREGLSINTAQAAMVDYEGNIWCGTLGGGVNLLTSRAFSLFGLQQGLTTRNVNCICPAEATGKYYVGAGDGLYLFSPGSSVPFIPVNTIRQLNKVSITSLGKDSTGTLWIGTQSGVYTLLNKNGRATVGRTYTELAGKKIGSVQKVICTPDGSMWIATYGSGVFVTGKKGTKHFSTETGLESDKILTMHCAADGTVWIGTQDAGLFRYTGDKFIPQPLPGGSGAKAVWSITEAPLGHLFIGTGEDGLYSYKNGKVQNYTTQQGLTSDYISALSWDTATNCLWAGGEKGLDKLEWDVNGRLKKIYNYKPQDGFNSRGINQNGIVNGNASDVWICGVDGLWHFNPQHQTEQKVAPQICIEQLRLFYKPFDWHRMRVKVNKLSGLPAQLSLPHNSNHLTFDIQALSAQPVLYTFKLQGQDEAWSAPAENNAITYSNLRPGSYTFMAKAITRQGIESTHPASFAFYIKPPWWSTWWFYTVVFGLLAGAFVLFIKTRERLLRQQNIRLEETVAQRTRQIAEQKQVVETTLLEKESLLHEKEMLLKEIHHRVKNNLQTISSMLMLQSAGLQDEQAKKAIAESQNRVRSIALVHQRLYQTEGIEKIELGSFTKELSAQIASMYANAGHINMGLQIPEVYIAIDTAIPLGLILNELLTNSFKYAFNTNTAGSINITLKLNPAKAGTNTGATLVYTDSGPGLPNTDLQQNINTLGLRLVKLLARQIGAGLKYNNQQGSTFTFEFTIF